MSLSRLKKWIYGSASVGLVIGVTVFGAILYASDHKELASIAPSAGQVRDDASSAAGLTPSHSQQSATSSVAIWVFGPTDSAINKP